MLRVLWCGLGLGFAILTIVMVTLFVPLLPPLVVWYDPKGLLAVFLVGGLVTGLMVFPSFVFASYIRSLRAITSPYYWIGVGGFTAFIANLFLAIIFIPYTNFIIFNSSITGGLAGGFVYSIFFSKETLPLISADLKALVSRLKFREFRLFHKPAFIKVAA